MPSVKYDPEAVALFVQFVRENPTIESDHPVIVAALRSYVAITADAKREVRIHPNQLRLAVDQ